MKKYPIYNFDFFDESINEKNSAYSVLSKDHKPKDGYWYSGKSFLYLSDILSYSWSKEDVDIFVEEYNECYKEIFFINDVNYTRFKYYPLREKREKIINLIL